MARRKGQITYLELVAAIRGRGPNAAASGVDAAPHRCLRRPPASVPPQQRQDLPDDAEGGLWFEVGTGCVDADLRRHTGAGSRRASRRADG